MRKILLMVSAAAISFSFGMTVCAAPEIMGDGTVFDAEYYAEQYPDVVAVYGTETAALYQHYTVYGRNEGRSAVRPEGAEPAVEAAGVQTTGVVLVSDEFLNHANEVHNYYKGIPKEKAAQADAVAKQIADIVMSNPMYSSDRARVNAAARMVACHCDDAMYGTDSGSVYYRSPAGVFVEGIYNCSGATRALGRVLDYMGFTWEHAHENEYEHQWCNVVMDGYPGYAAGLEGFADYGDMETDGPSFAAMFAAASRQAWRAETGY